MLYIVQWYLDYVSETGQKKDGHGIEIVINETNFSMHVFIKCNGSLENDLSKVP